MSRLGRSGYRRTSDWTHERTHRGLRALGLAAATCLLLACASPPAGLLVEPWPRAAPPDHVTVPAAALVAPAYASARSRLIVPGRALAQPPAGRPVAGVLSQQGTDEGETHAQTSQMAIADRQGNVIAVTTTNNLNFGARIMVEGVVLNNAMTNFSGAPRAGEVLANQMAPRKRPVTSMAPTIVFDPAGRPVIAGGSAGGGPIVDYVAASLIDMLAHGSSPAQAVARAHVTTATLFAVRSWSRPTQATMVGCRGCRVAVGAK